MTRPSWQDFGTHDESIAPELWDGVIGAWAPCLGPTGSRLHDMSRRSNWGTLTNMDSATDWVVDNGQYAIDLDGANDYVLIEHRDSLNIQASSSLTISAWIYRTVNVAAYETVITKRLSTGTFTNYELSLNNTSTGTDKAFGFYSGGGFSVSTTMVPLLRWTHLASVSSAAETVYYLDGRVAGASATVVGNTNAFPVKIGGVAGSPETQFLAAIVDDVQLRNQALSPSQIRELYQLGRGGIYQRRRRARIYIPQAGFQAAWARRQSQIIGGGL